MEIPLVEEITKCVWSLHPLKAPGRMDSQGHFFGVIGVVFKLR